MKKLLIAFLLLGIVSSSVYFAFAGQSVQVSAVVGM